MGLSAGSRLGPYEIVAPLGAGGMGEVFRARDTRLDRTVAIKVLLTQFSGDAELKQRFEREARSISSLQHPHICTLHDVGEHEGVSYLVMELLEGETLAGRLQRGPMPIAEIVKVASQIAEALDRAHRSGIVHRDLKPGNVMLTKDGAKLMDFGLAKPLAMAASSGTNASAPLLSAAVTLNTPSPQLSPLTSAGTIVGTIQYMSPEQIEGREADARSDIFAFGAMLYEMATGKRAFQGKSQITVASAILEKDPEPVSAVHPQIPIAFDRIVQTCLAKDPEERFQTAHDVKLQLRWVLEPSSSASALPAKRTSPMRRWIFATVGTIGRIAASLGGYWLADSRSQSEPVRSTIEAPDKVALDTIGDFAGAPVLSPDGRKLAFAGHLPNGQRALWVRPLDSFEAQHLDGTDGAYAPFWSPDSNSIGFFANGKLNRIAATGGPVTALAPAANSRGGAWLKGDIIVYTPDFQTPLYRIGAGGGTPQVITKVDVNIHSTHRWPFALPDGQHFLYLATSHNGGDPEKNGIYFGSLDGKETKFIVPSDGGAEYASGYLLYHAGTALVAQRFDPSSGKLTGGPLPVVDRVRNDSGVWRTLFTVSQNGRLLYQQGRAEASGSQLIWRDRTGKDIGVVGTHAAYMDPRFSPDGKRLAVSYGDPNREIWVFDLERGTQTRLTFAAGAGSSGAKISPSWSPDGKLVAYQFSQTAGGQAAAVYFKAANGSGQEKVLVKLPQGSAAYPSWSPDGKYIVYIGVIGPVGNSIYAMPTGGGDPFVAIPAASPQSNINFYRISPNGRWIAYVSNESGRPELYVAPFPKGDAKWQVSTEGTNTAAWRSDGKELYYTAIGGGFNACSVQENGDELLISTPQKLFTSNPVAVGADFDTAPDGKRFLLNIADNDQTPASLHLVTNWLADLNKK